MYLLDTDLLSQTTKREPDPRAARWLDAISREQTYLSVVSLQEIQMGIDLLADGPKRRSRELWLAESVLTNFAGRIYSVDAAIARDSGRLLAAARRASHTAHLGDALIAATARSHGMRLATLNLRHFRPFGVDLVEL